MDLSAIVILINLLKANYIYALLMIAGLWLIHAVNYAIDYRLNYFGIIPRRIIGLPGIVLSPLLHAHFNHLFFNSIPLFVLLTFMLADGWSMFLQITLMITLTSGSLTWLFGRFAIHIGASSVLMGYWGYLLINAFIAQSLSAIVFAVLSIYYFGSLALSLFPSGKGVSWEGHVFGFIAGVGACWWFGHLPGVA